MDCSSPGSSAHGILQVRILEWVVISFSRASSRPRDWTWVSCIAGRLFTILSHQGSPFWSVLLSISQTLHTCSYLTGLVFGITLPRNLLFPDYHTTPVHLAHWYNLSTPLHMFPPPTTSSSLTFHFRTLLKLLKASEIPKELSVMWVISSSTYNIRNWSWKDFKAFIKLV